LKIGPFDIEHILAVTNKEFREIYRDPRYIAFALALPIVLLFLYGYAITLDIQNLLTAYVDFDKTTLSRNYLERFAHSRYFQIVTEAKSRQDLEELMERSKIRLGIVIPADFSRKLYGGKQAEVEFIVDGTWPNMANLSIGYIQSVNMAFNQGLLQERVIRAGLVSPKSSEPIVIEPRVWFNESLNSLNFIIPGLYAAILMSFPPVLCAVAIVREK
jgi:ABC-2 type transport system permease protein